MLVLYGRQLQLKRQVEENISDLEETVKENSLNLDRNWESLDKNDPEELIAHFKKKSYSIYSIYLLEYNIYLQNKQNEFFSGTLRTQAREFALLEIKSKIVGAYLQICEKWECNPDTN